MRLMEIQEKKIMHLMLHYYYADFFVIAKKCNLQRLLEWTKLLQYDD